MNIMNNLRNDFMTEVTSDNLLEQSVFLSPITNQQEIFDSEEINSFKSLVGNGKVYKVKIEAVGADKSLRVALGNGVIGVIPLSDVYKKALAKRDLNKFIGREVGVAVTDVAPGNIVYLSVIVAQSLLRKSYISTIKEGDTVTAVVTNVDKETFKVFIDIDGCGVRGFIPIKEWDYKFMYNPLTQIRKGTTVHVKVKKIYTDNKKDNTFFFRGSRKELLKNPWIGIATRFSQGTLIPVVVTDMQAVKGRFYATSPLFNGLEILCDYPDNSTITNIENLSAEDAMVERPTKEKIIIQLGETYLVKVHRASEEGQKLTGKVVRHLDKASLATNK